jgi:superfamily II DNA or RNA helicase
MLLAWLVGAGKTIGMAAILFGINHVRKQLNGGSAKRIKRVLWLVHQRSLVKSLAEELRTELTKHGIADSAPSVEEVETSAQWGFLADIIVACPQSLWDVDNRKLDEHTRARILSEFDAIVVDEAHFGIERYLDICTLAPTAFKFAVTATPMNGDGEMFYEMDNGAYRDWFALFSKYGYSEGFKAGFYKELKPFEEGLGSVYLPESGGSADIRTGQQLTQETNTDEPNNASRWAALIGNARRIAKVADKSTNYDHHIMVRVGSISHAKSIAKALENKDDVSLVYSGAKGPSLGDRRHPWMLAKQHKGRIPEGKGTRIVITIDIGQFGINNPYCSIIVWVEPNQSFIEIIQRIGRAIRLIEDQDPSCVRLIWDAARPEMAEAIKWAVDYLLDMEQFMEGFVSMSEIADDNPRLLQKKMVLPSLKSQDRINIASMTGEGLRAGLNEHDALELAIQEFKKQNPKISEQYLEKAYNYGEALQTPEGRASALYIPEVYDPIRFVQEERAPLGYEIPRLIDVVSSGVVISGVSKEFRDKVIRDLRNNEGVVYGELIVAELREIDEANRRLDQLAFYPVKHILYPKPADSKELPFVPIQAQINSQLMPAFIDKKEGQRAVGIALRKTLADMFGFVNFKRETYQKFEPALADTLMRDHIQRLIIARTKLMVIKEFSHVVPGLRKRFEHEV